MKKILLILVLLMSINIVIADDCYAPCNDDIQCDQNCESGFHCNCARNFPFYDNLNGLEILHDGLFAQGDRQTLEIEDDVIIDVGLIGAQTEPPLAVIYMNDGHFGDQSRLLYLGQISTIGDYGFYLSEILNYTTSNSTGLVRLKIIHSGYFQQENYYGTCKMESDTPEIPEFSGAGVIVALLGSVLILKRK